MQFVCSHFGHTALVSSMLSDEDDIGWLTQLTPGSSGDCQEDFETFVKFCYEDPSTCVHEEQGDVVVVHQNPPGTVQVVDSQGNFNVQHPLILPLGIDPTPPDIHLEPSPPITVNSAPPVSDRFGPLVGNDQLDFMQKRS